MSKKETLGSAFAEPLPEEAMAAEVELEPSVGPVVREFTDAEGQKWKHIRDGKIDRAERAE